MFVTFVDNYQSNVSKSVENIKTHFVCQTLFSLAYVLFCFHGLAFAQAIFDNDTTLGEYFKEF